MEDYRAITGRIQRLMAEQGITQAELMRRAKIGKSSIHRLVTGSRRPTSQTLGKIAEGLGVSCDYLVYGEDKPNALPADIEHSLRTLWPKLSSHDQMLIRIMIQMFIDRDAVAETETKGG